MPTFVTLVGFPAVGKSTYAANFKEKGYTVVSADDAWREVAAKYHLESADETYALYRSEIYSQLMNNLNAAVDRGDDIVFDALNLSKKDRELPLQVVKQSPLAYTIKALIIYPPEAEIHADRLMKRIFREKRVNAADGLFQSNLEAKFQLPTADEGYHSVEYVGTAPKSALMSL